MQYTDKATLNGLFVTTQESLFRDVNSNLLSHGDIGLQHKLRERELLTQGPVVCLTTYLLHKRVRLSAFFTTAVTRQAILVQLERQAQVTKTKGTIFKPTIEELLRKALNEASLDVLVCSGTPTHMKNKDILFYARSYMAAADYHISKASAINNALSVLI